MAINDRTCAERNNCDKCPFKTNKAFCDLAFNSNKSINEILEEMFKLVLETKFKQEKPDDITFVDRDAKAALFSLHCLSLKEKGIHEDFRWLARKLDEIINKELDKPQELYDLIKEKKENAKIDYEKSLPYRVVAQDKIFSLQGEIEAYTDVLCLMESMFKVKTHD